jgi:branched-chain amino acid transport system substrate-binding protein
MDSSEFNLGKVFGIFAVLVLTWPAVQAQTKVAPTKPYASINRDAVYYAGPGRETAKDLAGDHVTIGMILPLRGVREAEGRALLQAAQLAIDEEAANPLPDGRRLALAVRDESGPWGQASNEIVRLVFDDQAVAVITSPDGNIAHQAEQIANKIGVTVLTLSSDATTTQINMPWIFRMGPSDADQARAFARDIYQERGFRNVLLLVQTDHDGRVGGEEFERAARELHAPPPDRAEITSTAGGLETLAEQVSGRSPEAIVVWSDSATSGELLPLLRRAKRSVPIYLCSKAVPSPGRSEDALPGVTPAPEVPSDAGTWTVTSAASAQRAVREEFEQRYRARTGAMPSVAAAEAYDAVRLVAAALRRSGANRVRLRDQLAAGRKYQGTTGDVSFDTAGNARGDVVLVRLDSAGGLSLAF